MAQRAVGSRTRRLLGFGTVLALLAGAGGPARAQGAPPPLPMSIRGTVRNTAGQPVTGGTVQGLLGGQPAGPSAPLAADGSFGEDGALPQLADIDGSAAQAGAGVSLLVNGEAATVVDANCSGTSSPVPPVVFVPGAVCQLTLTVPVPTISALSPTEGPAGGGTAVTISGAGLVGATTVDFGPGNPSPSVLVSGDGQVVAASPPGTGTVQLTVQTPNGSTAGGAPAQFTYITAPGLGVQDVTLPGGSVGTPYSATLQAEGGTPPYSWSVQGTLPAGLSLEGSLITGTPTAAGTASLVLRVADHATPPATAARTVALIVAGGGATVEEVSAAATDNPLVSAIVSTPDTQAVASGGTGTVSAAEYSGNPAGTPSFSAAGAFFDVSLSSGNTFTTLEIRRCGVAQGATAYWWTGTAWAAASAQSVEAGCLVITVAPNTSPSLAELGGTVFGIAQPQMVVPSAGSGGASQSAPTGPVVSVGPLGGTLGNADGSFRLVVPPGTLPAGASLSFAQANAPAQGLPQGMAAASARYTVRGSFEGTRLEATVHYQATPLHGLSPFRLAVYRQRADGSWVFMPTTVDRSGQTVGVWLGSPTALLVLAATRTFPDLGSYAWARLDIDRLLAASVLNGFPDGTLRPGDSLTRAEFVAMLVRTLGLPQPPGGRDPFLDVPGDAWFAPAVLAAVHAQRVQGLSPTSFGPEALVTREQMAVLLARALRLPAGTTPFSDAASVSPWAVNGVGAAAAAGYISGFPDGTFRPQDVTTRGQAAKVLTEVILHLAPPR